MGAEKMMGRSVMRPLLGEIDQISVGHVSTAQTNQAMSVTMAAAI